MFPDNSSTPALKADSPRQSVKGDKKTTLEIIIERSLGFPATNFLPQCKQTCDASSFLSATAQTLNTESGLAAAAYLAVSLSHTWGP